MRWQLSHRASPRGAKIADRHYSRQKPGTKHFVKPGRCLVMLEPGQNNLWVTSWPFAEYCHHKWAGAWECALFRKEGDGVASEMILEAVAATIAYFGSPPRWG